MTFAVELNNIRKEYPGVVANNDVSLFVEQGEIHGLIGENGAGKSTIMNILYGMAKPDSGVIKILGEEKEIQSPHQAIQFGIGMVHQHFMLMPNLSVLQNIILGRTPTKNFLIDEKSARKEISEIMSAYDLNVDLDAKIEEISVGQKQRVEIVKALYRQVKILIMDEPTAVLTPSETDKLMEVMQRLKEKGCTIIFITHKLREVMHVTDRITVMQKGIVTGRLDTKDATIPELSRMMVGREVDLKMEMGSFAPGEKVLEVSHLSANSHQGLPAVRDVSFDVRQGEIVGIAGIEGNGQTELIEAISGMIRSTHGEIMLSGKKIDRLSVRKRREYGMAHIPEDRLKFGVSKECTIMDNLILNRYYQKPFCAYGVMDHEKLSNFSEELCQNFHIKTPDASCMVKTLSGGNMQKVVFAREVEIDGDLLIAAQPTRGVDIGAIEYIHKKIIGLRDSGKAVLLVSAELDEIMSLSDRILVMYEGEIVAEFSRNEASQREIGEYMMGAKRQDRRKIS